MSKEGQSPVNKHEKNDSASPQMPSHKKEAKRQRPIPFYRSERVIKALDWLYTTFPKAFNKKERLPLKIGLMGDLLGWLDAHKVFLCAEEREVMPTKKAIRDAVTFYTKHVGYQRALIEQDKRYDLEGVVVDEVQASHKTYATERYEALEKSMKVKHEKCKAYQAKQNARRQEKQTGIEDNAVSKEILHKNNG